MQSAFGILTNYGTGSGTAAVFDDSLPATAAPSVGLTNAANPGEVLTFYGSGIGPDPGNPNETIVQKLNNLTGSLPIEVDIGGIPSTILYAGRSIYPGLDQINVYVPSNVTPGCHVSLVVRTGNYVSNSTTLGIASNGRTCSDPNIAYTATQLEMLAAQSTVKVAVVGVGRANDSGKITNGVNAVFENYPVSEFLTQAQSPSYGSCVIVPSVPTPSYLDAGAALKFTGPGGETGSIAKYTDSSYFGAFTTEFIPATGGSFTVSDGAGGSNVGAFTTAFTIPPQLNWTNMGSLSSVTRSQGFTVTWTGASSSTFVRINGTSPAADGTMHEFECAAPFSAGQFTVPPSILLAIPASTSGMLTVYNYALPVSFTAAGLDAAFVFGESNVSIPVNYK